MVVTIPKASTVDRQGAQQISRSMGLRFGSIVSQDYMGWTAQLAHERKEEGEKKERTAPTATAASSKQQ